MRGWRWGHRGAPGEAPPGTLSQGVSSTLTFVAAVDATALAAEPTRDLGSAVSLRVDQGPDEEARGPAVTGPGPRPWPPEEPSLLG